MYICTETCTQKFTAALFIMAKKWKQPNCPSADEWVNRMYYIHMMKFYAAIQRVKYEYVVG